ncbi:class I SAM-dependent methyltransferase [Halobium palmae]|uniref:Class I SAM-dependent methyltransferase n=1 Tax=Halobium palmae TaxID=1776492 RepID=A0ABD5RVV5_9EURY
MSVERWRRAQQSEHQHPTHTSIGWTADEAAASYRENYGIDLDGFDGTFLVVGAGTGRVHALDIDGQAIGIDPLYQHFDEVPDSEASLATAAGEYIPLQDRCVDIAASHNVLDHVVNPLAVLNDIHRVLDEDGTFALMVNVFLLPAAVRRLLNSIDRPHPHHFAPDDVRNLLDEAGFKIVDETVEPLNPETKNAKMWIAINFARIRRIVIRAVPVPSE